MPEKQKKKGKPVHEVIREFLTQRPFVLGFSPHSPAFIVLAEIYARGAVMPKEAIPGMIETFQKTGKETGFSEEAEKVIRALKEQLTEYEKAEESPKREKVTVIVKSPTWDSKTRSKWLKFRQWIEKKGAQWKEGTGAHQIIFVPVDE